MRKLLVAVTTVGLALAVAATPAGAVDADRGLPGFCPDANGVTVIIDFQELGGDVIVRCAPGPQGTGHAALVNAGIEITGTARWGEAFICRIEGRPGPQSEPCVDTPPATAYWSYWHAPNGGSWTYSQWGVMNRTPPPGSFEGWSFSLNRTATTNPPPRLAPVRPSGAAGDDDTAGDGDGGDTDPGSDGANGAGADQSGEDPGGTPTATGEDQYTGPTTTSPPGPLDRSPGMATPIPTGTSVAPSTQDSQDSVEWTDGEELASRRGDGGGGPPAATLLGVGAAVTLMVGAVVTSRRRNRRTEVSDSP